MTLPDDAPNRQWLEYRRIALALLRHTRNHDAMAAALLVSGLSADDAQCTLLVLADIANAGPIGDDLEHQILDLAATEEE